MSLRPGTVLGHYEVLAPLGAGGMGEVYRARDNRLGREVALKILPNAFVSDPDRLARFQREARTLASLNHPHIAQVYGFEEIGTARALVLELVEGEDLAQRLARGALPLDEALPAARQIAEALEVAHEAGIVHRDLKPANIKVRADGQVKVLDFGLAKAMEAPGTPTPDPALSPTLTSPAMTMQGAILGTAAYMAPEQARGKPVDKRADIWAFGVVLYEMLTGTRAFGGANVSDVLAAVLRDTPAFDALPAATPPAVRLLLTRCLERDPSRRLRDIGEARIALDERSIDEARPLSVSSAAPPAPPSAARRHSFLPWAIALASAALAAWTTFGRVGTAGSSSAVQQFDIAFPRDVEPSPTLEGGVSLSPDGSVVAMTGVKDGERTVFIRRLDSDRTIAVARPGGVNGSVFSPDSARLAFLGGGLLRSYTLADGEVKTLAHDVQAVGALAWGQSGVVFSRNRELWIVSPDGGQPRQITSLDATRREVAHTSPTFLPDGRTVLFSTLTPEPGTERIEAVSASGGPRAVVLARATSPVYSPSGHLLFTRDGVVLATEFDAVTARVNGTPVPVFPAGQLSTSTSSGTTVLRVADNGTLVFVPADSLGRRLLSVTRDGAALPLETPPADFMNPRLSPDRRRVLLTRDAVQAWNVERKSLEQLTTPSPGTTFAVWNRDGTHLITRRFSVMTVARSDGSSAPAPVPHGTADDYPNGPGPGNDTFLVSRLRPETGSDIFLFSTTGAFAPRPLVATSAYEAGATLSRDLKWMLYGATEGGRSAIYLRRYPALDRQWQVSEGTGRQAMWSADGREIYYRDGASMVAVPFDGAGNEPVIGRAVRLFRDDYDYGMGTMTANYDVTPDGRFLMLRREVPGGQVRIVVNWTEELKRIMAAP